MRKMLSTLTLAGLVLLAACDRKPPEEEPALNNMADNMADNEAAPAPENNMANAANVAEAPKIPPPPSVSEEQQMKDDADATGLTSRLPDENGPENKAAPGPKQGQ